MCMYMYKSLPSARSVHDTLNPPTHPACHYATGGGALGPWADHRSHGERAGARGERPPERRAPLHDARRVPMVELRLG